MHPGLGLQPPIGVEALDLQGDRLDPRLFAGGLFQEIDLHAMRIGPAAVHPQQHTGPVAGLGPAGPGVDLDEGIIAIGLPGQQGFQLRARAALP